MLSSNTSTLRVLKFSRPDVEGTNQIFTRMKISNSQAIGNIKSKGDFNFQIAHR